MSGQSSGTATPDPKPSQEEPQQQQEEQQDSSLPDEMRIPAAESQEAPAADSASARASILAELSGLPVNDEDAAAEAAKDLAIKVKDCCASAEALT